MFQSAADVAKAALHLLTLEETTDQFGHKMSKAGYELAAAILANQVYDWHYHRRLGRGRNDKQASKHKEAFKRRYPSWKTLRQIANGAKHPHSKWPDVSSGVVRYSKWRDKNWWSTPHKAPTLFVDVDGAEESVHSLVFRFCTQYLKDYP